MINDSILNGLGDGVKNKKQTLGVLYGVHVLDVLGMKIV